MEYGSTLTPQKRPPHPVVFDVEYPERLSRLTTFFRLILVIPHLIVVYLLSIPLIILTFLAWFGILFTGRYPRTFFDFNVGIARWIGNVGAYTSLLRDEYPPFGFEAGQYPVAFEVPYPERQSRWRLFIRAFAIIPNWFVFYFVQFAWYFTSFIAWWAILFTGRFPRGLHRFGTGAMRWYQRQLAYLLLLRDEYPPYSISADAKPGNEAVSAVIGFPFFAAYVAIYALQFQSIFSGAHTVDASLAPGAIARDRPSAKAGSLRVTLLDYERTSFSTIVTVEAEKDGWLPTFFTPVLFSLEDCDSPFAFAENPSYGVEDYEGDSFDVYWRDGTDRATLFFDVPPSREVCAIKYFTMSGELRFRFR